tara:strand:- start:174 stop:641 length:468 start_codon:yes stop_codon:yes gene_type:complete
MRLVLVLVLLTLALFSVILFWPSDKASDLEETTNGQSILLEDMEVSEKNSENINNEERHELMKSEYEVLEKERRVLKQRLGRLKHHMWGMKFEQDEANEMSDILLVAHKLIKNPDMLGAFSDVEGIKNEIAKIKFSNKSLDRVSEIIQGAQSNKK